MNAERVKLVVWRCVLFCGAALAVWTAKQAANHRFVAAENPQPALTPLALADLSDLNTRVALAEALADTDGPRLRQTATTLLDKKDIDVRVWRSVFQCWMKANPQDAWVFAIRHPDTAFLTNDYRGCASDPRHKTGRHKRRKLDLTTTTLAFQGL